MDNRFAEGGLESRGGLECLRGLISILGKTVSARRRKVAGRFEKPSDWRRLVALGVILILFAALELLSMHAASPLGEVRGAAAMFGGVLFATIIIRLGRSTLYIDWILVGALYIWLGLLVMGGPVLSSEMTEVPFALFCLVLFTSAFLRTWIGLAVGNQGMAWLVADGGMGFFFVLSAIAMRVVGAAAGPDFILVCDLIFHGISVIGFGLSIAKRA